ncbi:hypothetical protein, partial [Gaiella sp.]|uniref:hypothetical protein n=1 Tax=Gaiella sp. TaxID=2663207 RepID=UPI002C2C2051
NGYGSKTVHLDLVHIVAAALTVHEVHIRRLIGATQFRAFVGSWVESNMPTGLDVGISLRHRREYSPASHSRVQP